VIPTRREAISRIMVLRPALDKNRRPYLKKIKQKANKQKGWGCGSKVEHLPSKCEVLSSNSSTAKKKKERKETAGVVSLE
jgi:hypothetical protein